MSSTRLATANAYDNAMSRIATRQSQMSKLQEQISASKRVLRPSDDPTAAAQAERATTRMARVATDQRALEVQRNAVSTAESTLNDAMTSIQTFRTLVVQAGGVGLSATDRASIAQQMTTLRDELVGYANTRDTNGQPLFGGLGSTGAPFVDNGAGVNYQGIPGQPAASEVGVPAALDGHATWMDVPTGNGVFAIAQGGGTSAVWSDAGQVNDPAALTGHGYRITFAVDAAGATTYDVKDSVTQATVKAGQPYKSGQAIAFDGLSLVASGKPAAGDSLVVSPSTKSSLFGVLDQAIASVRDSSTTGAVSQGVAQSLVQIDAAASRVSSSRGRAGDLLNRVDSISNRQETRSVQLEADRSRAEDLDTVKAISEFKTNETVYSAALSSYAQVQKLSLFNFIS
jgi:flagellar hook-associated protein 3 FlgL